MSRNEANMGIEVCKKKIEMGKRRQEYDGVVKLVRPLYFIMNRRREKMIVASNNEKQLHNNK